MIGGLLKQLTLGLGRFARYHAMQIFSRKSSAVKPDDSVPLQENQIHDLGLNPQLLEVVKWPFSRSGVPDAEILSNPVYQLWSDIEGGFKWDHYFPIYNEVFAPLRDRPMRVLEIGILNGGGLRLWRKYFSHPDTLVVGIDINPACAAHDAPHKGIRVKIGNQADPALLQQVIDEFGPFDLIIDDGSHISSHIMITFNYLFSAALKDPGIYFVEDLHANYWPPWRDTRRSFLDLCKELIELMHAHYLQAGPNELITQFPSKQERDTLDVPLITTMIKEIRFFDSTVAIYKSKRKNIPTCRMIYPDNIASERPTITR